MPKNSFFLSTEEINLAKMEENGGVLKTGDFVVTARWLQDTACILSKASFSARNST